jgi:hypothetical protein
VERLVEGELDGEVETEGLADADVDGESEPLGDILIDGEVLVLNEADGEFDGLEDGLFRLSDEVIRKRPC